MNMMTKEEIIKNLRKKLRKAKDEINYLNVLLSDADEGSWDQEGLYEDARDGTFNGTDIGGKPDKKMASWLAKRYNLNEEELDDE